MGEIVRITQNHSELRGIERGERIIAWVNTKSCLRGLRECIERVSEGKKWGGKGGSVAFSKKVFVYKIFK